MSRTNGVTWKNVTPKDIGDFTRISIVEPSPFDACGAYVAANRYQLDDERPILYKTTDCGATWTKIVSGIPADEFTRVIRADPVRRGLLFAGTERGVWVSFDDGGSWQTLRRNLPRVPVHDLTIKEGDLIAATHGRSFWLIDDLSAIRQMTPITVAKNHLYKPRDTYRTDFGGGFGGGGGASNAPPSGVMVQYNLTRPGQTVTLEFMDVLGKTIRSFTSEQDPAVAADSASRETRIATFMRSGISRDSATRLSRVPQPGGPDAGQIDLEARMAQGPLPPRVPNAAGLNTFSWNLRYPDAERFAGLIMWAASTSGPIAPPGTYSVRMRVNGDEAQTQTFVVKKDPRSEATLADLTTQFRLLVKIRDRLTAANNGVKTVRNLRWQTKDRGTAMQGRSQEAEFKAAAEELMRRVTAAEEAIYQTKNQSNQDPLNYPIRLNNKIAALAGVVGSTEARPTDQSVEVFTTLDTALGVELKRIEDAIRELLPKVNAALRAAGVQPIVPSTQETKPGTRPAAAMNDDVLTTGK